MASTSNLVMPHTTLEAGIFSFWELSAAFVATMTGNPQPVPLSCGVAVMDHESTTSSTYFYLDNPFPSSDAPPCAGSDWVVIGMLVCIIHTVSWGTRWMIWEPLANWRMSSNKTTTTTWNKTECKRFSMTCAACTNFTLSAFFAWNILMFKPWLLERSAWVERGPLIDADFKFYYLMYAARFLSDMVSLFFESRQLDALIAAVAEVEAELADAYASDLN